MVGQEVHSEVVPKPHRLDTELGPPSWHRVSTSTVPPEVDSDEDADSEWRP